MNKENLNEAIKIVGSQKELAKVIGCSQSLISHFMTGKVEISPVHALKIEQATKGQVKREYLCPDFPWDDVRD